IDHTGAALCGGCDIEKDHFIRALLIVTNGQFHRIAHITQLPGFGLAELHASRDVSSVHIQTGNDSSRQHVPSSGSNREFLKAKVEAIRSIGFLNAPCHYSGDLMDHYVEQLVDLLP